MCKIDALVCLLTSVHDQLKDLNIVVAQKERKSYSSRAVLLCLLKIISLFIIKVDWHLYQHLRTCTHASDIFTQLLEEHMG